MLRTIAKKLYKEIHSKTLQVSQNRILKKCPNNLQEGRKNERNKREQIENKINKMEEACPNINNYIKCRLAQHTKTEAGSVDFKPAPITCCPQETDFAYDAIGKLKVKGEKKNLHHANANPRKQERLSD